MILLFLEQSFAYLSEIGFADNETVIVIFTLLGGLGIFLFGIRFMGDGLKSFAGDKMKDLIQKYTDNPLKGVIVGAITTMAIQSSSGTTALTIGLVRSGLMTFKQAIGVIMGANIGTTVTALLVGLRISDYSLPIMAVGGIVFMFANSKKPKHLAEVIFGFGALFFGLSLMGDALKPIAEIPAVAQQMVNLSSNSFAALLTGTAITFVVQSSSAVIGIVQELFTNGSIDLAAAIPLTLGSNIGTTVTAVIAALGASVAARRASFFHTMFNTLGAIIFMFLLVPFIAVVQFVAVNLDLNPAMQIAFAHGIFNIIITIMFFPFVKYVEKFIIKVIPAKEDELSINDELFDNALVNTSPKLALVKARNAVIYLGKMVSKSVGESRDNIFSYKVPKLDRVFQLENMIDSLEKEVQIYLQAIGSNELSHEEVKEMRLLSVAAKNYERANDHFIHIIEFIQIIVDNKDRLSKEELKYFKKMYELALELIDLSVELLLSNNVDLIEVMFKKEDILNNLEEEASEKHYQFLQKGEFVGFAYVVYIDMLNSVERIGDYGTSIAKSFKRKRANVNNITIGEVEEAME